MIDSRTKLGRSTPKLILLVLVQIFQHLLEKSVSEKASHHWSVVECRREVNFIEKISSNKRSKYTRRDKSYHTLINKNLL